MKKTGGGAAMEPLPPLLEKINNVVDPILITGDEEIEETGRMEEVTRINFSRLLLC